MRMIIVPLAIIIFATSLFGLDANAKYDKVVLSIEKHYYQVLTKYQIMNKGMNEFLKTTSLLTQDDKIRINIKFNSYDNKYGINSKESIYRKIKITTDTLLNQMFSKEKIYEILIDSTLRSLDAHSSYLDKKHMQDLKIQTEGVFGGLGITVSKKEKKLIVVSTLDDSPAFKAGIKAGDKIIKISEIFCENILLSKAVTLMRGKVGTYINLTIDRKGHIFKVNILRDFVKVKSVEFKKLPNNILYLKISVFDKKTFVDIAKVIEKNEASSKGIVLDLRNNPGGLLSEAVNVADIFMNRGNIITQKGRSNKSLKSYDASSKKTLTDVPLVILINAGSASASEILSGALQIHKRATLIGEKSFGKGIVQTVFPINKEESIKLTVAQYFLADGKSINNIGITPDYEVNADIVDGYDIALEVAENYFKNKNLFYEKLNL